MIMRIYFGIMLFALLFVVGRCANAHEHYTNWTNQDGGRCCNGQDCHELDDDDLRVVDGHYEVRLHNSFSPDSIWCEVKPWHFTKTGNDPNGDAAHVCAKIEYVQSCKLLLCFRPKTGF